MNISIIVAAAENDIIGRDNKLLWHLSGDMKHFKALTTGHTIIMGRKTYQSIGRALPNRRNIVISRNPSFLADGCECFQDIDKAISSAKDDNEIFIIGGGEMYHRFWHIAQNLYLTRVHITLEGDTSIPKVSPDIWQEVSREDFQADEKNTYPYSFINYRRI